HVGPRKEDALEGLRTSLERPRLFETIMRRADGGLVPVEVAASPVTIDSAPCVLYAVRDITVRRRAEIALAERKSRLRAIVDNAPFGIGVADLVTGELVEANPALLAIYGRSIDELAGRRLGEHTHPEDQAIEQQLIEDVVKGIRNGYTLRKRNVRPDGSTIPVELRVIRLPDELGRHPLVLGIATDLQQIADAERSLRESEERFRRLADNAQDIIYRVRLDPGPAIEYVSPGVQRLTGRAPAEFYADPSLVFRVIHEEDRGVLEMVLKGIDVAGRPRLLRWLDQNGAVVYMEHRGTPVHDSSGALVAVEGIARDVTESIAREQQLRIVGRALEQATEVVIITDRLGRIIQVNDAFERVTGYRREEVMGQTPRLLQSGRQGREFYEAMWKKLSAGEVFSGNLVNRRKDGSLYDAELVISPVRSALGELTHFVAIQRDVSVERAREAQLRQAQKMEAMGQVTGGIAHDFNNLLTVILATANLLESELPKTGETAKWLADLVDSARHGTLMVRQLLAFGRQEILNPGPTDLGRVVQDFAKVLHRLIPETVVIAPITGTAPMAQADRTALEQILLNLANNAKDAMPNGGKLTLTLGERPDPESGKRFATIAVADTGTGMDAETLRRCTEPYFTTKPVGKGTGLGLPMVHGLMQQLGGRFEIESTPGKGSTFTLLFPLAEHRSLTPIPLPSRPTAAGVKGRILLAEDNESLRRVAVRTLERAGATVVAVEDGEAAWATWESEKGKFDLVLTDAVMPRLGGVELIQRLRATGTMVPIVLMSGYTTEDLSDLRQDILLLAKPWTGEALLLRLREALAGPLQ
ncbi:MAG TPA: PAS domain S-box protein, partial [Gemmatimonadales bacterium]|nr:PAS domain S-box protein [Gemmatimonadales bacterium]